MLLIVIEELSAESVGTIGQASMVIQVNTVERLQRKLVEA